MIGVRVTNPSRLASKPVLKFGCAAGNSGVVELELKSKKSDSRNRISDERKIGNDKANEFSQASLSLSGETADTP